MTRPCPNDDCHPACASCGGGGYVTDAECCDDCGDDECEGPGECVEWTTADPASDYDCVRETREDRALRGEGD